MHFVPGDTSLCSEGSDYPQQGHIWTQGLKETRQGKQLWDISLSALKQSSDFSIGHQFKLRNWA